MKKVNKILSGSLLVALMSIGLVTKMDVKNDKHLDVHDVLTEDVTKDVTGKAVRRAGEAPAAENKVSEVKAQVSEELEGKRSIRFVAGIDSYDYYDVTFNVSMALDGEEDKSWSHTVTMAYERVVANGEELTAAEAFGEDYKYLVAFTVNNVPQAYWDKEFAVTTSVKQNEEAAPVVSEVVNKVVDELVALDKEEISKPEPLPVGVSYDSVVNTAVNGAWVKYFLTWTNDDADIAEFITASSIDGTIGFSHSLDLCEIKNDENRLQYGLAFASAAFQAPIEHTLTVTIKTVNGDYYEVTTRFIGASGGGIDMETVSTTTTMIQPVVVTLNAGEGTCDTASINVLIGGKYGVLPTASREGHNFVGWYTEETGGSIVTSGTVVTDGVSVLYARYTEIIVDAGVSYNATINTAVNGAWVKFFLTWTDDSADIAEFVTASAIDGSINFAGTLDYCNINNDENKLQYGLAFASAAFQAAVEHTLTVTVKTVAGETYDVTVKFIGASGSGVDMVTISTETTLVA